MRFEVFSKLPFTHPRTAKELSDIYNLPYTTTIRFINRLFKEGVLIYVTNRNLHPKRYPIKFYFKNPVPKTKRS